jgi:hypothetical protein
VQLTGFQELQASKPYYSTLLKSLLGLPLAKASHMDGFAKG